MTELIIEGEKYTGIFSGERGSGNFEGGSEAGAPQNFRAGRPSICRRQSGGVLGLGKSPIDL